MDASIEPRPIPGESPFRRGLAKRIWMLTGLLATGAMLACLVVLSSRGAGNPVTLESKPLPEPVKVAGPGQLTIEQDSAIWQSLAVKEIERETIETPLLQVTGFVLARVVAGNGSLADRWRFNTSELSGTYADWLRIQSEVRFAESQLDKTRQLAEAETRFLASVVKRLDPLAGNTSVPEAQILQAKADLLKAQLLGEKDIFSADSTLQSAKPQGRPRTCAGSSGHRRGRVFQRGGEYGPGCCQRARATRFTGKSRSGLPCAILRLPGPTVSGSSQAAQFADQPGSTHLASPVRAQRSASDSRARDV